jgi:hypothetical protein
MKYLKEYIDFSDIEDIHYDGCDNYPDFNGYEEFCKFLVDRGVIDKFIKNFNKLSSYNDISKFLSDSSIEDYIAGSFAWISADGGYGFWNKINSEWLDLINGSK